MAIGTQHMTFSFLAASEVVGEMFRCETWGSQIGGAYILALLDGTFNISPFSRLIITPRVDGTNGRQVMFQSNT